MGEGCRVYGVEFLNTQMGISANRSCPHICLDSIYSV